MPVSQATVRRLRRVLIGVLALGTTVLAVDLIVHALTPGSIALTPTAQLVTILALLILPACTIAAWAWDRAVRQRLSQASPGDQPTGTHRSREHPAGRTRPHATPAADDTVDLDPAADQPATGGTLRSDPITR